ncbi:MAG: putative DNA modification/repair radical SAM protein [Clostridium sp.]|uniref:putative DNA modification/repair radical SAM protein n=1 Tax=Clostridium sp. TaxID=1506 RepID=UPI001EC59236|nr:putative DNA modification/repair radical SAM protein [Clostridium sp.]MBS5885283.1 putative DNA modification/repair radical SAM protein [Clostridium sp.]MDU7149140.1 putative DNA modification/repair radical SAM protein [Clostridium sp.]MDU7242795.1 putative DNA modification/repair radical SAM protein [Clostridium sp.]
MNIDEKLNILSAAAKYDVSCSSSGSKRKNLNNGIGNAESSGICHSFTADGRCISLLKILLTNYCIYNCKYCVNASTKDVPRAMFTPDEIVSLTINFYKRNYIEGLFLSSAIFKTPNYTMELLLNVVKKLRIEEKFNGYIHLKAIPGADEALIKEAGKYADRMSVNIELPSASSLKLLAPQKSKENILAPMSTIKNSILENKDLKKNIKSTPLFVPGGQSTQLIVGATPESDYKILNLSENLYNRFNLKRVYYSAYVPVIKNDKALPDIIHPPLVREHRLYQADWLLRFYGFKAKELLKDENDSFDLNFDPKTSWALSNIENFPIEINKASYDTLLRIPGIGVRSARRILITRKVHSLTFEDLKKLGIVLKRAKYFITCKGKYYGDVSFDEEKIRTRLLYMNRPKLENENSEQLNFFDNIYPKTSNGILLPEPKKIIMPTDKVTSITGEF